MNFIFNVRHIDNFMVVSAYDFYSIVVNKNRTPSPTMKQFVYYISIEILQQSLFKKTKYIRFLLSRKQATSLHRFRQQSKSKVGVIVISKLTVVKNFIK